MNFVSMFAIYFIIWWVVLFVMLPVGFRSQEEEGDVTLGTVSSAPGRPHMAKALVRTTLVSLVLFGLFYYAFAVLGWRFEDMPRIGPHA